MPVSSKDVVAKAASEIETISAADAAREVGAPGTVFVDVREAGELETGGTVQGAHNIPRGLLEFRADPASPLHVGELDPAKRIVLFCAAGGRSTLAAKTLKDMGFSDVASVEGGFPALKDAGAPTTKA